MSNRSTQGLGIPPVLKSLLRIQKGIKYLPPNILVVKMTYIQMDVLDRLASFFLHALFFYFDLQNEVMNRKTG